MKHAITPRILIIGAGAMGRVWAGHLQQACPVMVASRSLVPPVLRYLMITPDGLHLDVSLPVWSAQSDEPDLILVTTKAPDAERALYPFRHLLTPRVPVLLLQNGLGSQQAIATRYPQAAIAAASTTEGAYIDSDRRLVHAGTGTTWIGGLTDSGRQLAPCATQWLRLSGLTVEADDAIEDRLWQKLAVNAGINPFTALLDCPNGDLIGREFFERRIGAVCREVAALMQACNIPASAEGLEARVRDVARQTAANSSSMRQDVRAGKPTEIEMMNGYIARESAIHGLEAPVNLELTNAIKALH